LFKRPGRQFVALDSQCFNWNSFFEWQSMSNGDITSVIVVQW
jgi:hypothetical protein